MTFINSSESITKSVGRLSVVMPAYNEQATIGQVIERVLGLEALYELVIVDDHSSDDTAVIIAAIAKRDGRIKIVRHEENRGKTAGLKTGIAETTGDIVV